MATPTYDLLASTTLATSASSVTFSSIDQNYGDLILVTESKGSVGSGAIPTRFRLNADSGDNYSYVLMNGDGSSANSQAITGNSFGIMSGYGTPTETQAGLTILQIMDYSATDKHKAALTRANTSYVEAIAQRWADTSAVNSISVFCFTSGDNFAAGSTFNLYGVAK